ncbi:hypothetical protein ES332_A01G227000v1 [Gossypium tomentosum]|uniref:hAT-like transposase RNase-H fold domain-containing protein n=1 Tax=Gossypium tomentosum TaxID=34277 RepID=A0A5D2RV11_GOSTO|nr:hypothetical protein ES332_A01G227000v1 [Gossypium tomentosum]
MGQLQVQCNHCKIKLAKNKDGTTTQYKRHLDGCVKRQVSLKGQDNLFLPPQAPRFDNASGIQTWKYDQAKIREVCEFFTLLMKTASLHYVEKKRLNRLLKIVDTISIKTDMQKLDCGIEGKVCSISVNNASYNDAVVAMLKDSLSFHKRLPLNGKLFHVRCCAHILNLLVHDGHSEIENIIVNVRESVKHIKASTMHLTMFSDIVKQLQLPNKRLILNCCTRWNATYAMLSCVLEFKDVFPRYYEDWVRVEEVCYFLALFNEVANIIPGSEYPTSNLFFLDIWSIKELLMEKSLSEELRMRQMVDKIQRKFDKYWGEFNFLYELYQEYVDEYATANVGTSMENDVQESGVSNASTTSRIGKGKVMIERSKFERYIRSVDTVDNWLQNLLLVLVVE